ncbi:hypothetical protein GCK72_003155 [Caenorhabditis remanei]|uniref:F-box domain-containing protein n=1 Tax=Caenorhabditis remanei TaxID=31234 RepID=A0A6A5HUA4_CAERE|nr:hypothetical protein GCK72_003155 [Caenorhabditis remanei]KAF1771329.1 hypothetical protein GCK72_003155 [Caenorhabditis remanei]
MLISSSSISASMTSPFPLLRLPGVVLCEIFKSLNIGEKIQLSLCSKKVSIQINNARMYSQKVIVNLDCSCHEIKVYSENYKDSFEIFAHFNYGICDPNSIKVEGRTVSVISVHHGIKTFWRNHQEGFISVIRHLLKIFRCKFSINNNYCNDSYEKTISELFDLQEEFKTLTINFERAEDQHFWNQISNKLGMVENLIISSTFDSDIIPAFTSWPQKITIMNSNWVTLQTLLSCPCSSINIQKSRLENKDLDEILKNWKSGGFPNLERLEIQSRNITSFLATILGMNLEDLHGKVIQTDDGSKKAIIRSRGQCIVIKDRQEYILAIVLEVTAVWECQSVALVRPQVVQTRILREISGTTFEVEA